MPTSRSNLSLKAIQGLYYNGVSSRVFNVSFSIEGGECLIKGDGIFKAVPLTGITVSERLDSAHRILRFSDGSSCELPDNDLLSEILDSSNLKDSFTNHLQRSWRWVLVSLLLLAVVFISGYKWGIPYVADKLAYRLPYSVVKAISQQALSSLDKQFLQPSKLPPERQSQLRSRLSSVIFHHAQKIPLKVEFRESDMLGANAFALPDGTILFLDKLVQLSGSDDELVAVYAHEAGHVAYRHSMRQLIQGSIVAIALAAYFGDVSSLAGALSGFMLQAKYSRDFEREADRYAANVLKANNIQPQLLGTFLKRLEGEHNKRSSGQRDDKLLDYISSHPSTDERMKEMEKISNH
jgi:Zn-dependent protease with chaperone function